MVERRWVVLTHNINISFNSIISVSVVGFTNIIAAIFLCDCVVQNERIAFHDNAWGFSLSFPMIWCFRVCFSIANYFFRHIPFDHIHNSIWNRQIVGRIWKWRMTLSIRWTNELKNWKKSQGAEKLNKWEYEGLPIVVNQGAIKNSTIKIF